MSVSAIASLRPIHGQCLRQARVGLLSVQITSRTQTFNFRATIPLRPNQRRFQSNGKDGEKGQDMARRPTQQPKMTTRQLMGRAITISFRNLAYLMTPEGFRQSFREAPFQITFILFLVLATLTFAAIQLRLFYNVFYNKQVSVFPEPVASTLRRAIYYTTINPHPDKAFEAYSKAMGELQQLGMDPLSDEVLGVKIMIAWFLEKVDRLPASAGTLEKVQRECLEEVDRIEKDIKDGKVGEDGYLKPEFRPIVEPKPDENTESEKTAELKPPVKKEDTNGEGKKEKKEETQWHRRERILRKAVATGVKLGELYADPHVLAQDASHKHLIWAVETTLREFRRRKEEGPKPGEESWMTPTEVGGSMESLGRAYERKSQFHLAIPLFFQALRTCDVPCHRAVIMNNLSACFAQHPMYSPAEGGLDSPETQSLKDLFASSMPNTRDDCLDAAVNWARNAYLHAKDTKGDDRTPECDEACAVALCNWGDVAAMQGNAELAKKKYLQSIDMSKKLDFPQGVQQAQAGLKNLSAPAKKQ